MKALVVYESVFGNTQQIAQAIGDALEGQYQVTVAEVNNAPKQVADYDLVVVGGPTHAWGMSRASGRRNAAKNSNRESITGDFGLRDWFTSLDRASNTFAAAFDTRARGPFLWLIPVGSAARGIAKNLRRRGFVIVEPNEGFMVTATEGPLADGELDRAKTWGRKVGGTAARLNGFSRQTPADEAAA